MTLNKRNKVILSFDLEFWYDASTTKKYLPKERSFPSDFLKEGTLPILDLLKRKNIKATFFVTGKVAEKYPELIKEICGLGHEIGVHGFSHTSLDDLTPQLFEEEIEKAVGLIKEIIGKDPKSFRAPNFSLNNKTKWALPILAKYGFRYDSSVFPLKTPLYGVKGAPNKTYRISFNDVSKIDSSSPLTEMPLTIYSFLGIKIPIAGGVYFRLLPLFLYKRLLKAVKGIPILYFHPYDLDKNTPFVKEIPCFKRKLKYCGIKNSLKKLEKLIDSFQFCSIENYEN